MVSVLEYLRAREAEGHALGVSRAVADRVEAAAAWEMNFFYGTPGVTRFASGVLADEVIRILDGVAKGGNRVFSLFSAHDTTVGPFLHALGLANRRWPKFAANVVLELAEEEESRHVVTVFTDETFAFSVSLQGLVDILARFALTAASRSVECVDASFNSSRVTPNTAVQTLCGPL